MTPEMILDRMAQMIRVGFVNARQPEKMRVKVTLKDTTTSELITDWLPVLCPRASKDMQYDLPDIGDQVLCLFLSYGLEQGFVVGAMYGAQTPPVQSGDKTHRTFSDGATIEYDRASHQLKADIPGTAVIKCKESATIEAPIIYLRGKLVNTDEAGAPGKANISGELEVTNGGINVPDADVVASGVSLVSHKTEGVQSGHEQSSHPVSGSESSPGTAASPTNEGDIATLELIQNVRLGELRDKVEENGSDIERLITCLPEITHAIGERALKEGREKDAKGLFYLERFFKKWLAGLANEDINKAEPEFIDFEWMLEFERARNIFDSWTEIGDKPHTILSPSAIKEIGKYLKDKEGIKNKENEVYFEMTGQEYFNHIVIPGLELKEIDPDSLEGLFSAMGAFDIRAQISGVAKYRSGNEWRIYVKKLCVFVRDQFNFPPEVWKEFGVGFTEYKGTFGNWSCLEKKFNKIQINDSYLPLNNSDFINFRRKYMRGEDFLVLSKPYCIDFPKGLSYDISC